MMGGLSIWHWLVLSPFLLGFLLGFVVPVFPIAAILSKAGRNPAWAFLWLVPFLNIIGLFVFAYSKWPEAGNRARDERA